MSTRLKRARKASSKPDYAQQVELDLSGSSSEEEEESDQEEKVSKRKISKKGGKRGDEMDSKERKGKGSKGKGKAKKEVDKVKVDPLDQLPFELVSEILSQLTPKDLLNFSRTNKQYRSILMSKNRSNSIWKSSRRRIGLPDLTAEDFSEPAYAALVFDTHCQHCDRYAPAWVDYVLRLRLCKPCRRDHIIKITARFDKEKRFHPATLSCVTRTSVGFESYGYYGPHRTYVLSSDLEYYHKKLSTLQEDDNFDGNLVPLNQPQASPPLGGGRRRMRAQVNYREKDEIEEEEEVEIKKGGRVERLVAARKEELEKIYADGETISSASTSVLAKIKEEQRDSQLLAQAAKSSDQYKFQREISNRLALVNGYARADANLLTTRFRNTIVKSGQTITNEIWTSIESKVLAAIDKAKLKNVSNRKKEKLLAAEQDRKKSLRKYYNDLKRESGDKLYFPLFDDFLQLSAVKPLWQAQDEEDEEEETIDESTWKLLLPLIRNDLEDSHVELVSSSIRLILSTHHDYKTDEELEDAIQEVLESDLDSFFSLASSLVMCGGGCRSQKKMVQVEWWPGRTMTRWRKQGGFIGSVPQVVAHLLQEHNGNYSNSKASKRRSDPIILPLEVASTISAVLEVGQLDESIATVKDLNQLDRGYYRWDDSKINKKNFNTWRDLVNQVSLASHKAERARRPYHLDPPLVIYYPSSLPPPPPASEPDEQDSSSDFSPKNAVRKEDDSSEIEGSDEEKISIKRRKLKYTSEEDEEDEDELDSE